MLQMILAESAWTAPSIAGYVTLISALTAALVTIIKAIKDKPATKQLLPNGGKSLADKVNQIHDAMGLDTPTKFLPPETPKVDGPTP